MEESQLKILSEAIKNPDSREIIKDFLKKNCSEKIYKIMIEIIDNYQEGISQDLFEKYASMIMDEYVDMALDEYNDGEIEEKDLELKIKNLEFDYIQTISN